MKLEALAISLMQALREFRVPGCGAYVLAAEPPDCRVEEAARDIYGAERGPNHGARSR